MEWLGFRLIGALPQGQQVLLACDHQLGLVFMAYLVACAGSYATLDIAGRIHHADLPRARARWSWTGAACLAGGIWAMHFISMLAFSTPLEVHYDLPLTVASFALAATSGLALIKALSRPHLSALNYVVAATSIGLGIASMHYVGMAAMRSEAIAYYHGDRLLLSVFIAMAASLAALLLARHLRDEHHRFDRLIKISAALVMGLAIVSMHFTGMWALELAVSHANHLPTQMADNRLQLGLTIAIIALLIFGSCASAAIADKKLQRKERDLRQVSELLSELDRAQKTLHQAAHNDALTNLVNRRGFNELFEERLRKRQQSGDMLAVMFLDIDHFKRINDSLGHDAGDELLKAIAEIIKGVTRDPDDVVARFGGDEFCLLLTLHQRSEARLLAERIMKRMKTPIDLAGRRMVMTTSIGISVYPDDGTTSEELLKHADLALYQSKGNGRNSASFFRPDMRSRASLALHLEEELREALRNDTELELYYQPILDVRVGHIDKVEALVRWRHPKQGLLAPQSFIGIAETNGLIAEMDSWVIRRACRDLKHLNEQGLSHLKVAVNCSALNLTRAALPQEIEDALAANGVPALRLELELTESALMLNIHEAINILQEIRALGVSLLIDDFGTGYSSLAYLKHLPLDTLKIDRTFIQDLPHSARDLEIVRGIIALAHTLKLEVVVEGVETMDQRRLLQQAGCEAIQGFVISAPVSLLELPAALRALELKERKAHEHERHA